MSGASARSAVASASSEGGGEFFSEDADGVEDESDVEVRNRYFLAPLASPVDLYVCFTPLSLFLLFP